MLLVGKTDLANGDVIVLYNIVFSDVNLFHRQVLVDLFWIIQVLCVTDYLCFYKESQTVSVKDRKAQNTHQQD